MGELMASFGLNLRGLRARLRGLIEDPEPPFTGYEPGPSNDKLVSPGRPDITLGESFYVACNGPFMMYAPLRPHMASNNDLSRFQAVRLAEEITGRGISYFDLQDDKTVISKAATRFPKGSLIARAPDGKEWYGAKPMDERAMGLLRLQFNPRSKVVTFKEYLAQNRGAATMRDTAETMRAVVSQWTDKSQKTAHLADIEALLAAELIIDRSSASQPAAVFPYNADGIPFR